MSSDHPVRPLALITGASSGLGAAFAERLARDQFDLLLVARRRERLEELGQRLQREHGVGVEVLPADLSVAGDLAAVERRIVERPHLARLVNNAGFGAYMRFIELEPDQAEALIRVQVVAVARLTRAALPGMIARGEGAVINVSSRLAFSGPLPTPPLPYRATYAGAKAFINSFTQLLAGELHGTGVRAQALCPGLIATEFHERVGANLAAFPAAVVMSPQDVVQASLAGLVLGEVVCVPALEDASLLAQVDEAQRKLFAESRTGGLAGRYQAKDSSPR
jgi:short-subunit dehydrogenase